MEKFSEGYKLFCRFCKEVKIYSYFLEYQRRKNHDLPTIPIDTKNIINDLAKTSISYWLEREKRLFLKHNVYFTFKYWLEMLYQSHLHSRKFGLEIGDVDLNDAKKYGVDIEKRTVKLCKL